MASRTSAEILAQLDDPTEVPRESVRILLSQSLRTRHKRLDAEWQQAVQDDAKFNRTPAAPKLASQIEALEAEIEEAKDEFVFESIGKLAWANLIAAHPPTKEQKRDQGLDHNPQTFPPAAVAACCVKPAMTLTEAAGLHQKLNSTQWDLLMYACVQANIGSADTPKSMAVGLIHRARSRSASSATAKAAASPEASSSAA